MYYLLIKISFLVLCIIILFIKEVHFSNPLSIMNEIDINQIFADAIFSPKEAKGEYPGFANFQLNYENECSKYFKYRKNSKQDIVIFAYTYRPEKQFFHVFDNIIDTFRHSIPKATIASVIPKKDINSEGASILNKYGIKLIPFEGYENYNIVTSRYVAIYDFLKNNTNQYKKVFLSDIDDVYIFRDIFSTFSEDEIIINNIILKINKIFYFFIKKYINIIY